MSGKGSFRDALKTVLLASTALSFPYIHAVQPALGQEIVPANATTTTYTAPNGVPVVNIAGANPQGLSHNSYNKFNVGSVGAVLNNSSAVLQSNLAGAIPGNPYVAGGRQASIILNEVVQANRSTLNGFIEVNGQKADVIIANPWGISANGLGFINAGRATLTTGTPNVSAAGKLTGFDVTRGDLLVEGDGINGTSLSNLDLVVRSAQIGSSVDGKGQINAQNLHLTTGANRWNYDTRAATRIAGSGVAPSVAIDSRAFGGMYANRIKIVATEAGVGVKALGEMAASAEDLVITSSGTLELKNKISAEKAVAITYDGGAGGKIMLDGAATSVSAKTDITLAAGSGDVELVQGSLNAGNDLTVSGNSLSDSGALSNVRSAKNNVTVTSTGATTLNGTKWVAGNDAAFSASAFSIGANSAELYSGADVAKIGKSLSVTATSGDVNLNAAKIASARNLTLSAAQGAVNVTAGGGQKIESQNDIALSARTAFVSSGQILAKNNFIVRGTDAGADLAITNSGLLQAAETLDFAGQGGGAGLNLINNAGGKILAKRLAVKGKTLNNAAANAVVQGGAGSALDLATGLNNSGAVIGTGAMSITAAALSNSSTGGISSTNDLTLTITSDFTNDGALYAGQDLSLTATGRTVTNAATGTIDSGRNMTLSAGTITNRNDIRGAGDVTINTTVAFNNLMNVTSGTMTDSTLTLSGMTQAQFDVFNDQVANREVIFKDGNTQKWKFALVGAGNIGDRMQTSTDAVDADWSAYQYFGVYFEDGGLFACADGCANYQYKMVKGQTQTTVTNTLSAGATVDKSLVSAGGALTLNIGNGSGTNDGSILSAATVNINGSGNFTNNARAQEKTTKFAQYKYFIWARDDSGSVNTHVFYRQAAPGSSYAADGNWVQVGSESEARTYALNNLHDNGTVQLSSVGAGIFANTLNVNLTGTFTNVGSTVAQKAGASQGSTPGTAPNAANSLASLGITVPTNPNGLFVITQSSNAAYLIETNPAFGLDGDYLGSDYLYKKLNIESKTDKLIRRLGDANYEQHLIQKQITQQTGRTVLAKYKQNAELQTKALFDNAATAAQSMKLSYGVALTREQVQNLKTDIVWMVKKVVQGQEVLAPVVYLAQATRDNIDPSGAVVVASNANISVGALTNTGGTIEGNENLNIASQGDITNTAGTIRGGNVQLASAQGSIINETTATDQGGATGGTILSKTAAIEATRNLNLDAAQDITVTGGQVKAGGDAKIKAGGDVSFTNLQTTERGFAATNTHSGSTTTFSGTQTSRTSAVASGLAVGGNMDLTAGQDLTVQGSDVNVKGGANIDVGGDILLEAATETTSRTDTSGSRTTGKKIAGLVSTGSSESLTVKTDQTATARASTLNIGGDLTAKTGGDFTSVGSDITVGGSADLKAGGDLQLLSATESRSKTSTSTSKASSGGIAGVELNVSQNAKSWDQASTARGSTLKVGQDLKADAGNDMTLQGSKVDVAGNADLNAKRDINILTAEQTSSKGRASSTSAGMGILSPVLSAGFGSENSVAELTNQKSELNIGGNLKAASGRDVVVKGSDVNVAGDGDIDAGRDKLVLAAQNRKVEVSKSSQNFGLVGSIVGGLNRSDSTTVDALRNQGSTEDVGGNLNISAKRDVILQGSQVNAGGNANVDAGRDQLVVAAQDKTVTTTVSEVDKGFSFFAEASGSNDTSSTNGQAGANVQATGNDGNSGSVGVGIQRITEKTTMTRTQTTAVTSGITAGGDLTRRAGKTLVDQGTQIKAGGDYRQSATDIKNLAAQNTDTTTTTTETTRVRMGLYAEGAVEQNLTANARALSDKAKSVASKVGTATDGNQAAGTRAGAAMGARLQVATAAQDVRNLAGSSGEAGVSAGAEMRTTVTTETNTTSSTTAVTSNIQVGGGFASTSTGSTTFEGTTVDAGGDIQIAAKDLNVTAARDTQSSTTSTDTKEAYVRVGAEAGASYDGGEGEGDASAALMGEAGARRAQESETTTNTQAVVASFSSGGGVTMKAQNDASLEGTKIKATDGTSIKAGGNVDVKAAADTTTSTSDAKSFGAFGKLTYDGSVGGGGGANMNASTESASSSKAVVASIDAGQGGLSIQAGNDVTLEGTKATGQGALDITAGNAVNVNAAVDNANSSSASLASQSEVSVGDSVKASARVQASKTSSRTETGAALAFGSGVNVTAKNDVTLVGTAVQSGGDVNISAGGQANILAAKSDQSAMSLDATGTVEVGGENNSAGFDAAGAVSGAHTETGVKIQSDGNLNVSSGGKTVLEGTQAAASGDVNLNAGGGVEMQTTENYSGEVSGGVSDSGYNLAEANASLEIGQTSISAGGQKKPKPPKKVADTMKKIKELMSNGQSRDQALRSLGVSGATFKQWTQKYADLTQ